MYVPQPMPFMPSQPQQQYNAAAQYQPPPPSTSIPQGPAAAAAPLGTGFMGGFSPMTLMTAGGLLAAPQQYMQQRVSWIKSNMTGGTMSALFNISNSYVANKLFMLLAPFLGKWTYARMHEQIAGGQRYRPPSVDVNAPDLFIPLMGLWSYALLSCIVLAFKHSFKPDMMSNTLYSACFAWGLHWLVARLLLRALNVPGVAWSELLAYTGYPFVMICLTIMGGFLAVLRAEAGVCGLWDGCHAVMVRRLVCMSAEVESTAKGRGHAGEAGAGKWGYYALGAYGSLCMAVFMVKTMKRVIFQETRTYGADMRMANYLLLAFAAFQFPFAFWLAYRPAPFPDRSIFTFHFGPKVFVFNVGIQACTYIISASLPLLLMLLRPKLYRRWRLQLCLMNRLLRLSNSTLQLTSTTAVELIAKAIAARTHGNSPSKALAINLLHPAGFWMQQANFILPWRWVLVLQLVNFAASLRWSAQIPCLLRLQLDSSDHLPFGKAAVQACGRLQDASVILRWIAGDPLYLRTLGDKCADAFRAVQLLQVVISGVMLLVLPLTAVFCLESWCKLRFLQWVGAGRQASPIHSSDIAAGMVAGDGGSSDSSSTDDVDVGQLHASTSAASFAISRRWTIACNYLASLLCLFLTILFIAEFVSAQPCSLQIPDNSSEMCQSQAASRGFVNTD
eukprot:gene5880-6121_t